MYVCMYVCMHGNTYAHIYIPAYAYKHVYATLRKPYALYTEPLYKPQTYKEPCIYIPK